jgi:S-adenosylmethionine decarboxylase
LKIEYRASSEAETSRTAAVPGLHILANLAVRDKAKLSSAQLFKAFVTAEVKNLNLTSVGEVYHEFPNNAFTAVICLTESHLSVHTWPEHDYLTFDIFLSNHLMDNREKTKQFYRDLILYFEASIISEHYIDR